jgi:hypothetical protein
MKKHFLIGVLILGTIMSCTKSSVNNNTGNNNNVTCTGTKSFATDVKQIFNARAVIRSAVASGTMPKNSTLSATQKNAIICWIDNGATDN